eukprot:GFYU01017461.1.p1 GENE.GFYU01017461.1~~GFYU01017461.1.p1  ORF type:complete len:653 (-),score=168.08 GFYU01017461.1:121-2079(-)
MVSTAWRNISILVAVMVCCVKPTVADTNVQPAYLGCWKIPKASTEGQFSYMSAVWHRKIEECFDICGKRDAVYVGVTAGYDCVCFHADLFSSHERGTEEDCCFLCNGVTEDNIASAKYPLCGGKKHMSIYNLKGDDSLSRQDKAHKCSRYWPNEVTFRAKPKLTHEDLYTLISKFEKPWDFTTSANMPLEPIEFPASGFQKHLWDYSTYPFLSIASDYPYNPEDMTLNTDINTVKNVEVGIVTQLSVDRLPELGRLAKIWDGPISAAIFIRAEIDFQFVMQRLRANSESAEYIRRKVDIHLVLESQSSPEDERKYPINVLRNVALKRSRFPFTLVLDVDFVPNADAHSNLVGLIKGSMNTPADREWMSYTAIVVPAFEGKTILDGPITKKQLHQMVRKEEIVPSGPDNQASHGATNYQKYFMAKEPFYAIEYEAWYEPYTVAFTAHYPPFDGLMRGWGIDKVASTCVMHYSHGFNFVVATSVFAYQMKLPKEEETSLFSKELWDEYNYNNWVFLSTTLEKITQGVSQEQKTAVPLQYAENVMAMGTEVNNVVIQENGELTPRADVELKSFALAEFPKLENWRATLGDKTTKTATATTAPASVSETPKTTKSTDDASAEVTSMSKRTMIIGGTVVAVVVVLIVSALQPKQKAE